MPIVPVKTTASYDAAWPWRSQNGIKDERGHYHQITNVFLYSPFRELPDHTWVREGLSFRNGPEKVTVQGSIGFFGLAAGPEKHLVDRNALSDPLLARLPVSPRLYFEFYAGHYFRDIPDGYLETLESGTNRLADPSLHQYYDRLNDVLRGPLFSAQRLQQHVVSQRGRGPSVRGPLRSQAADRAVGSRLERTVHHRRRGTRCGGRRNPLGRPRRLSSVRSGHPDEGRNVSRPLGWATTARLRPDR